jgi:hypothetical protein
MSPTGPFKLVTVNTAPDRAKRLIGRVVEDVKDTYTIIHAGNADSTFHHLSLYSSLQVNNYTNRYTGIDEVRKTVEEAQPNVLVSIPSRWQ